MAGKRKVGGSPGVGSSGLEVFAIQEALKYFSHTGESIINISSVASQNPGPNTGVYAASKAVVDALTLSYAKEFATRKIRVKTIAPGNTETGGARAFINVMGKELENAMIPLKKQKTLQMFDLQCFSCFWYVF